MIEPSVHPTAARGFEAAADAYEHARPTYPRQVVDLLVDRLDLRPGRTLLELGAGTGKLTRLLAPTGVRILALEPVAAMRERLLEAVQGVEPVDGTAEAIGLAGGSVDAVVVAQAFHWFDAVRALSEIHRVLRPDGVLALAWNFRDESVAWVAELGRLIHTLSNGSPQARGGRWRADLARSGLFGPWTSETVQHAQSMTPGDVVERVASVSFVASAPETRRSALLADVRDLVATHPETAGRATVDLPYESEVLWAPRVSPAIGREGVVVSVGLNGGGVPKPPVDGAWAGRLGLDGDGHTEPETVHGGPERALCLYAQEAIERVREDGHQAFPGAYGENVVVAGLDWASLRSGDRLAFGQGDTGLLVELTRPATPCQTIAHWFVDRRIARISQKVNPQDARWYASVVREGRVEAGMRVRVEGAGDPVA